MAGPAREENGHSASGEHEAGREAAAREGGGDAGDANGGEAEGMWSVIDRNTFNQLLEMDDDEGSHDFSKELVYNYFDQVQDTFAQIEQAMEAEDLASLSSLGHFLKGSSAALGLKNIQRECERLQNYGAQIDDDGGKLSEKDAMGLITEAFKACKNAFGEAEKHLRLFYND